MPGTAPASGLFLTRDNPLKDAGIARGERLMASLFNFMPPESKDPFPIFCGDASIECRPFRHLHFVELMALNYELFD